MNTAAAMSLLLVAGAYLVAGLLFALAFVFRGAGVIDPAARGAPLGFRAVILPGAALLWPLLALKWARRDDAAPAASPMRPLRTRHLALWLFIGPASIAVLSLCVWISRNAGARP